MLTRSLLTSPRLRVAEMDLDPDQIARSAREIATHDLPRLYTQRRARAGSRPGWMPLQTQSTESTWKDRRSRIIVDCAGRLRTSA